jgi:hypothetical protein
MNSQPSVIVGDHGCARVASTACRACGRASFITAVRSLDRILDEAKLFLAVRDELDGRARSGAQPLPAFKRATGRLKCDGSRLRVRLPKTNTFEASKLNSSRHPGRGACLRDEVVAERKIVYLRNVGEDRQAWRVRRAVP